MRFPAKSLRPVVAFCVLGLVGMCHWQPLAAQDLGEEEDNTWKAEREKLTAVVEERIKEEVAKSVQKREIAEKLGLRWPVKPPTKTKEEVAAAVEQEIEKLAAKALPDSKRQEFETQAKELYRVFERGDDVEFTIRGGMGPNANVKGKLYETTTERVKVGGRTLRRSDMDEDSQARFWPEVSEEYQKRYIRAQNAQYDGKIRAYKDQQRATRLPEALTAALYLRDPREPKSIKLKDWHAESDILEHFFQRQSEAHAKQVREGIETQVFTSNGYVLVEDEINNTKEWMPKKQAASFRERIKELLEERKRKEEEAKRAKERGGEESMWEEPAMEPNEAMPMEPMEPMEEGGGGAGRKPAAPAEANPFD